MSEHPFFKDPKNPTAEEIDALEPNYIGPTWCRNDLGKWLLPERTLGWQIAQWAAKWLRSDEGGPWKFTPEQLRFLLWWYAVDENGRFVYRKGVLQRMKGWGKDPLLAVICLVEFVGPSRVLLDEYGRPCWREDGHPVGTHHPRAWVQVTAVNQSQTQNTMELLPALMSDEFKAEYGIKDGAEVMRARGGKCRLVAVTSSYRALEGGRTTFTLLNETHHWVAGNKGIKMYETIDGNITKSKGGTARYLAITNAYLPGEDSVAERMREAYNDIVEGRAANIGFLYDSLEAHEATPLSELALRIVLPKICGDAYWLDVDSIIQSVHDTTFAPSRSRRMWLNQIVAEEDAVWSPAEWKAIEHRDAVLHPGDEIVLGFDGGLTDDATALVGIRIKDATAFLLCLEERPSDWPTGQDAPKWIVNREKVDSEVRHAFRTFKVRGMYCDPALWESYISEWDNDYGEGLAVKSRGRDRLTFDMRAEKTPTLAHERLMTAVSTQKIHTDGDMALRRHALNARRRTNNFGISFGKESKDSPRKVDAYAALMLAHECLYDYRTRGKVAPERTGQGYFL